MEENKTLNGEAAGEAGAAGTATDPVPYKQVGKQSGDAAKDEGESLVTTYSPIPERALPPPGAKFCSKCRLPRPNANFGKRPKSKSGIRSQCLDCEANLRRSYRSRQEIKERRADKMRTFRKGDVYKSYRERLRYDNTPEGKNKKRRRLAQAKRRSDPTRRIYDGLIRLFKRSLERRDMETSKGFIELLGANFDTVNARFTEALARAYPDLTISDYGPGKNQWTIDHIVPMSQARNLSEAERLQNYINLQPLKRADNRRKSDTKTPEGMTLCLTLLERKWDDSLEKENRPSRPRKLKDDKGLVQEESALINMNEVNLTAPSIEPIHEIANESSVEALLTEK